MSESERAEPQTDHNVYILGAGFSKDAGPPIVKHFMDKMRDASAWLRNRAGREDELKAIQDVLAFRVKAKGAAEHVPLNLNNVEELFSLASTVTAQAGTNLSVSVNLAIAATLDFSRKTLPIPKDHENFHLGVLQTQSWKAPETWKASPDFISAKTKGIAPERTWLACPPYDFYLATMTGLLAGQSDNKRNTFVTFNYDTVIEDALSSLGVQFSYGFWPHAVTYHSSATCVKERDAAACVSVLKLHGSVNWAMFDRFTNMTVYKDYDHLREDGMRQKPVLVPPTWHKGWDLGHPVSAVWEAAVDALRTATRIIIIGYSVPPTDLHFKYLLATGFQDNALLGDIFFVNPDLKEDGPRKEMENRLFSLSGLLRRERLDEGMVTLLPATTREFFDTPADPYSKPHRIRIGRALCGKTDLPWETAPFAVSNMVNGFSVV